MSTQPVRAVRSPSQSLVVVAEEALELADVADLGPAGVGAHDPLRVGDHRHDLLADRRPASARMSIVFPTDLLIFRTPSVPRTVGASVKTACGSGNVSP